MRYSRPSAPRAPTARLTAAAACGVKENSPPAPVGEAPALGGPRGLGGARSGGGVAWLPPADAGRGQEKEERRPAASAACACAQACSERMASATCGRSPTSSRSAADSSVASEPVSSWEAWMKLATC